MQVMAASEGQNQPPSSTVPRTLGFSVFESRNPPLSSAFPLHSNDTQQIN